METAELRRQLGKRYRCTAHFTDGLPDITDEPTLFEIGGRIGGLRDVLAKMRPGASVSFTCISDEGAASER